MHVILCDLCMYDHEEKKIVLLAQKLRRKKLRIRKEIPIFVPGRRSSSWWPNIKKSSISFLEKKLHTTNYWRQDGMIFDDTEMFLFLLFDIITPPVDICGHYISCFSSQKLNSSDKNDPCCSGTVPSGT